MTVRATKTPRRERVAEQLREEIAALMLRDMKDPRVRLASISRVSVSPDLRSARVRVSVLGDEEAQRATLAGLRSATGLIRRELGRRLQNLKFTPDLRFEIDPSIEYSVRMGIPARSRSLRAAVRIRSASCPSARYVRTVGEASEAPRRIPTPLYCGSSVDVSRPRSESTWMAVSRTSSASAAGVT